MLDRADIDALLMGALYGELSPDESTRLDEHLSAHPQDKLILDGLSRARQAVKDSLILLLHAEPPAAVSALLMQEAARRAPAPREQRIGWFAKLVAVMRHPAVAAVTVVVLIAAVGGTIYLKNGKRAVVEREIASKQSAPAFERADDGVAATPPTASAGSGSAVAVNETGNSNGSGFTAGYTDESVDDPDQADQQTAQQTPSTGDLKKTGGKKTTGKGYIEVRTHGPEPKDAYATSETEKTESAGYKDKNGVDTKPTTAPEPPPPTNPNRDRSGKTAGNTTSTVIIPGGDDRAETGSTLGLSGDAIDSTTAGAAGTGGAPTAPQYNSATGSSGGGSTADPHATARGLHTRLIGLVKANKCSEASKVALDISQRDPDYYAQFVANDRRVKACKPYIDNARKKKNDAAKRATKDQPQEDVAPAPDTMKISE